MASPTVLKLGNIDKFLKSEPVTEIAEIVKTSGVRMLCPVKIGLFRDGSHLWTFPIEPLVSISASKTIARRNISKAVVLQKGANPGIAAGVGLGVATAAGFVSEGKLPFGTVKELWSQDDYQITIEGVIIGNDQVECTKLVTELTTFLKAGRSLTFRSWLGDTLNIGLISVESWEFPATSGLNNQRYTIRAYSDFDFELT